MAAKSKRLLKVIDGIRSWNISSSQPNSSPKSAIEIDEYLKTEHFQVGKISVQGFPHQPTCIAFDPVQRIVAVGTKCGFIRIFGRPGVDCSISHPSASAVLQIFFLVNEGGLVSICGDDVAHLWNIRQKNPEIVHSLQFKREHLTCGHLPVGSSWLYLGTDKGNVNFISVQRFTTSGYVINWNKAIDLSQSSHPGKVIQIAENPQDPNKILIGYSSGFLVLWDLKTKQGDARFKHTDSLYSVVWHWDGKSFLTSHNNGLLATWLIRQPQRPVSVICPHAPGEAVPDDYIFYEPIRLVEWLPTRNGEPFIIFSGGGRSPGAQTVIHSSVATTNVSSTSLPNSDSSENDPNLSSSSSCMISSNHMLTIKRGKKLVVLQLDHKLVQFTTLCMSPYTSETMDPYAVAILLQEDLVVIDLLSTNFATFENPYPMDLHSSPVTSCLYLVDCPGDLIPAFYSVSSRRNRTQSGTCAEPDVFSSREWPITGGEWRLSNQQVPELIITGHADGSVRFWDASEVSLTPLYKFRTSKLFANPSTSTSNPVETGSSSLSDAKDINAQYSSILLATESDPLAIHFMHFCSDSRKLLTASGYHTCLLHFSRREINLETAVMDINMAYDGLDDIGFAYSTGDTFSDDHLNTAENLSGNVTKDTVQQSLPHVSSGSVSSYQSASPTERDLRVFVPVRQGSHHWPPGYQPLLVCRVGILGLSFESNIKSSTDPTASCLIPPPSITAISMSSAFSLMAIGSEFGIAVVDYVHKICLLSISSSDLLSRGPINLTGSSASGEVKFCDQNNSSAGSTSLANTCIINNQTALKNVHSNSDAAQSSESSSTGYTTRYVLSRTTTVKSELKRAKSQVVLACRTNQSSRQQGQTSNAQNTSSEKCSDLSQFSHPGSLTASSSSLDNLNCETIKTILFSEWISPKQDLHFVPNLWIGTSRGCVLALNLKYRVLNNVPINHSYCIASLYRLRGDIIHISLLDNTGDILPSPSERWDDSFIFKGGAASELSKQASLISCSSICSEGTSMYTNADAYSSTDTGFKSCGGGGGSVRALKESVIRQNTVTTHTSSTSTSGHSSTILSNTMSGGVSTFQSSGTTGLDSPTTSKGFIECDRQLVVLCSEKQARVVALPSQNCLYKVKITETSQVVRASVQRLRPSHNSGTSTASFLACYLANGHFVAFSLPSLRLLMDVDYLPYTECVSRSFAFGQYGQSVYLVSPSELAKITWASDVCANLRDMQGEIFLPSNMPEPPKKNFFKNLLSGTLVSSLDRDELFGEASSGKGTPGATTLLPNARLEKLSGQTGAASSEIARARNAAIERGERLQQLDLQTQEMADQAKGFGRSAAILAAKYEKKDKRWGLPF
ncbi:Syntaxin-binding protein 5 [Schistosoma haematobium]|uniref:Syntaxin-binding protein 5 n=2 Tax=Schistosoma haematobium TaxID=6185 RepID=A0A922S2A6_SCHHA|nr:Syntaxin-binding protein 5 [Schistosoma haematobium]KAH9590913.1 Syntaxin-binding protein 5 [Schistosoma haematobium]